MEEKDDKVKNFIEENLEPHEEIVELKESLEKLEKTISNANSTKKVIWRGMLTGLSGVVGATIIFGLLLTLISGILYTTGIFPELNEFLNTVINKNQ